MIDPTLGLRIAIVSTDYPPLRTSAAVQLRDLAAAFAAKGHRPVVIVPDQLERPAYRVDHESGVEILRLDANETRVSSLLGRALAEIRLPFTMMRHLRASPFWSTQWDVILWYSPPIFFGPLIFAMRWRKRTLAYLVLRDIFPEWALDLGILKKGPAFYFLRAMAALQYGVADVIGVQTPSNMKYMESWQTRRRRVEVLHNWLTVTPDAGCSIDIQSTVLAGRIIFVYIGNIGAAQGMDIFVDLIDSLRDRSDIGFLFVGRGTEFGDLVSKSRARQLDNVLFFDEIDSLEIPGLLAQCHVGMVALHPEHKTHNIPGKFVSYMRYGLPVLVRANAGTDLLALIEQEDVGRSYAGSSVESFGRLAVELADNPALRSAMAQRGRRLGARMFSPETAADQIARAASERDSPQVS